MLATYCKAKGFVLSDLMKLKYMQIVQEKYGFKDWDSILAALGHGGLKEGQIVNRLAEEYSKDHRKRTDRRKCSGKGCGSGKEQGAYHQIQERYRCQGNPRSGGSFFEVLQPGSGR